MFKVGMGAFVSIGVALSYYMLRQTADDDQMTKTGEFDLRVDPESGELIKCPREKLIAILEDLQMEYTPYYTHYYHLLKALQREYASKPILQQKLTDRLCNKLE